MNPIESVVVLTAIISVLISLVTATTTAKRSSFEELEKLVKVLRADLVDERKAREHLRDELEKERKQRMKFEDWARRLVQQLKENHIVPVAIEEVK